MTSALLTALGQVLPADRIVSDPDVLRALSSDEAEWAPVGAATAAVGSALPVVTLPADARSNGDGAARTATGEA